MKTRREQLAVYDVPLTGGGQVTPAIGPEMHVNAIYGSDQDTGKAGRPYKTLDKAFDTLAEMHARSAGSANHARLYIVGPFFENLVAPAGVTGVSVIGAANVPRWGSLTNASEGGGASWRTADGVTTEPCLTLHTQGWRIENILFAPGSADAGIEIQSANTDPEKTGGSCLIRNCRFAAGKWGINDNGGSGWVEIEGNRFEGQTTASIQCTSTANALPLAYRIEGNKFGHASASHIIAPFSKSWIKDNVFGTVASTAVYVDLTDGANNMVVGNYLAGVYNTSDYVAGTGDLWLGNYVTVISTQAPNGFTILAPAAP